MSKSKVTSDTAPLYKDEVLEIEPHGLEHITLAERHGSPINLFTLWFAANIGPGIWVIGNIAVILFGVSMTNAFVALLIGNLIGSVLLGLLTTFGPRLGVPQMVQSRGAFGFLGNLGPGALNYLAGIGWFAVGTVYGTYALVTLTHINYFLALAIMVLCQIILAVYGYNMIHTTQKIMTILLGIVFLILAFYTFPHANYLAGFNSHAPLAFVGETGGFIITVGLALSYIFGWMPFASDYSRYLPRNTKPSRIILYTFLGSFISCFVLEWMGALTTSIAMPASVASYPTNAIAFLMPGPLAGLTLLSFVMGTISGNTLNIYSGALSALVIKVERSVWLKAIIIGTVFTIVTVALLLVSNATLSSQRQPTLFVSWIVGAAILVGVAVAVVVRFPLKRWQAAILIGVLGGLLASGGSNPIVAANYYSNFLLLLSYWIAPWVAVVITDWFFKQHGSYELRQLYDQNVNRYAGVIAWLAGVILSIPFWNQAWFVGPVPANYPQVGDLSYLVAFFVAAIVFAIFGRAARSATTQYTSVEAESLEIPMIE